jgi:hypothetical protein
MRMKELEMFDMLADHLHELADGLRVQSNISHEIARAMKLHCLTEGEVLERIGELDMQGETIQ